MDVCYNDGDQLDPHLDPPVWRIEPDHQAIRFPIKMRKDGRWTDGTGGEYVLSDTPQKYHNFNTRGHRRD